jgi:AAA15 family ATPase/GTPase
MHVLPAVLLMKSANEKVVVVDELDRRFHPLLTRMVVELALRCDSEHTHSQLIFTTHDTNLLDLELLRRDEIWFVEKDNAGASNLYSLADFKVRPDLRIEKGYLQGRFGALPFISSVKDLGWCEDSELIPTAQPADAVGQV